MPTKVITSKTPLQPARKGHSGYVLVVDDEEQNRTLLRDPLEAQGYEVEEAANGEQALKRVAERQPAVVLLDLMMPGMSGFEVCEKLKQDEKTESIPVLMVTALSERTERLMGIRAGANDFLAKPVDLPDLLLRVGNAARSKQLYDDLRAERQRSEELLLNVLPRSIAERMKSNGAGIADSHADVTVLVADVVGLTQIAAHVSPEEVVSLLNEIFSAFDVLCDRHQLEKIKTVGDGYMAAGGIPPATANHPEAILRLALDMRQEVERLNQEYQTSFKIRAGICTGPVVAGVIGRRKFSYDLWGDTVNVAWQLESLGAPGNVTVSESTHERVNGQYRFEPVRQFDVKRGLDILAYRLLMPLT